MAYVLKTNYANSLNYGGKRSTSKIKYIVIHYTANDGDTDENNGKYFKNNIVKSSAHYFVDDDSVTISVPDDFNAYHCGANKYKHAYCRNSNSLGIEICDDIKNGVIYPSEKTIENAVQLTKELMEKYNIPVSNVIRHFDVTGKLCPAYWCGTATKNKLWETEFLSKLKAEMASKYTLKDFVIDVQKATGAKVDGIAGKETLSKTPTVSKNKNNRHKVVKAIQQRLNALGYDCGTADGIAGNLFNEAVKAYQKDKKCVIDGEITAGMTTWKKLLGMA